MKDYFTEKKTFHILVAVFCLYGLLFILRTSFVIDDTRYFSLFDDAMVSMTFARNLADGHGLVWNPGEAPVEGYTNTLWVLYMALLHLLPVAESKISLLIQLTSLGLLTANLFVVRRIADIVSENSTPATLTAVFITAFFYPINNWALQGMEVGAGVLIVSTAVLGILMTFDDGEFRPWPYIVLGFGVFLRPDMIVPLAAIGGFAFLADKEHRWKHAFFAAGTAILTVGTQTAFRYWYFGDIYPNTFYLKTTGYPVLLRITRGLFVYAYFIWKINPALFLIPFALLYLRPTRKVLLLFTVFAAMSAYSVYVGGDHWEHRVIVNRYLCVVMPGFIVLFSYALVLLARHGFDFARKTQTTMNEGSYRNFLPWFLPFFAVAVITMSPKYADELVLLSRPTHINDNAEMVTQALLLREITTPDAKIAVVWAGAIPYFAHRPMIDLLGKCDTVVAHSEIEMVPYHIRAVSKLHPDFLSAERTQSPYFAFRPGNMKYDLTYSIGTLRPDIIMQTKSFWRTIPTMWNDYDVVRVNGEYTWRIRKDSEKINRDRLADLIQ